jgi:hypothetical protein
MELPGLSELLAKKQNLEELARNCLSGDEFLNVPLTREELGVVNSYREFMEARAAE